MYLHRRGAYLTALAPIASPTYLRSNADQNIHLNMTIGARPLRSASVDGVDCAGSRWFPTIWPAHTFATPLVFASSELGELPGVGLADTFSLHRLYIYPGCAPLRSKLAELIRSARAGTSATFGQPGGARLARPLPLASVDNVRRPFADRSRSIGRVLPGLQSLLRSEHARCSAHGPTVASEARTTLHVCRYPWMRTRDTPAQQPRDRPANIPRARGADKTATFLGPGHTSRSSARKKLVSHNYSTWAVD